MFLTMFTLHTINFTVLCSMNLVLVPKCYSSNELSVNTFTLVLGPCGNELPSSKL